MRLRITLFIFFIVSLTKVFPQSYEDARVVKPVVNPALKLTENIGQWDNKILFKAQLDGGNLFLERNCLTFNFYDKQKIRAIHHGGFEKGIYKDYSIKCHAYKVNFLGCNLNSQIEKYQKGSDYENFYLGNNPRKWKSNVNNYHQVWLKNLYNGIDYEVITSVNGLKYNFHLQPNSNVNDIKLQYDGADKLKIKDGALIVKLQINTIIEQKPFAYQLINGFIKQIPCNYKLNDNVLSFDFPEGYDKNYSLVIDPVLVFAAQAGSTADNFGMTATFDQQGNFYSGGTVFDIGYPFVTGSYSNFFNGPPAYGNTDIFLTKYNSTGNALLFSTYMGGNGTEVVTSLIVDKTNNLYLYGATGSANFPVLATGAYTTFAGGSNIGFISNGSVFFNGTDMYIAKFNSSGTTLLGSTYYGGSGNDGVNYLEGVNTTTFSLYPAPGTATTNITNYDSLQTNYGDTYRGEIQLDTLNNVYIASSTRSSDLPMVGGFDNTLGGKQDAVIAKFNTNLSSLIYSSFIGGSKMECGNGLFVTPNFEVFVTGGTTSNTLFPSMAGGQSPTYNGGKCDGFLCKINASGNSLLQSTYIGTNLYDNSFCVQCNVAGEPHVFGQSKGNMPVIIPAGASSIFSVTNTHQFITKYNNTLTTKLMSTVFGSSTSNFDISPSAFAVDECNGNIYLSGWGGNILTGPPISGMPLLNPTQATTTGYDFYLMALKPNASSLLYGSYFGGSNSQEHVDGGTSRFDRKGVIYQSVCAGCGGNQDFPHTAGAWPCPTTTNCPNPNPSGNCNNGVFKIDFQLQTTIASINTNTVAGCAPLTVNLTNSMPGTSYTWYLGPGNTTSTVPNPAVTFTNPGTYTISLVVHDTTKCVKKDSAIKIINVYQKSTPAFTSTITPCSNSLTATNTSTGSGSTYTWNFGDASPTTTLSNPTHTYAASGNYTITLVETNSFGCKDSIKKPVTALIFNPVVVNSSSMCSGYSTTLTANGGTSYTWTPTSSLFNPSSASTVANPTTTTIYTVTINNNSTGDNCTSTLTTQITVFPQPSASFSTNMNPCGGGVNFTDQSASNIVAWQWNLSSSITSTIQNPYNFYSTGGTHTINLIVTNNDGCKDTSQQIITVIVPPPLSINGNSLICTGNKAQLNASGGVSYQWTPTLSLDISSIATPVASPTISTTYSVIITTSGNCSFLLNTTVNVSQIPTGVVSAIASPPYIITGNSTTLTYLGAPGSVITWYPLGSTSPATGYTVSVSPIKPTTYTAVANTGACTQKTTVFVEAYSEGCIDKDVFVPNTFTPNADGQNDIFIVRGLKVQEIYFAIYNRWGELVFETTDKTTGWDGIYKGRPADVGVFGWYLKVKCFNGEETFRKGNVTLVR
ncbi:MAG: gliding motility-associated C-terminal domain-containing protein [Bacteroidetes bacterium]|nr:gliding motility-associated C-terminal domain-containing protein [Bacteroidota bacterium]